MRSGQRCQWGHCRRRCRRSISGLLVTSLPPHRNLCSSNNSCYLLKPPVATTTSSHSHRVTNHRLHLVMDRMAVGTLHSILSRILRRQISTTYPRSSASSQRQLKLFIKARPLLRWLPQHLRPRNPYSLPSSRALPHQVRPFLIYFLSSSHPCCCRSRSTTSIRETCTSLTPPSTSRTSAVPWRWTMTSL